MKKFSKKQRLYLYKFCADMIKAELPLYDALQKLRQEGVALLGKGFAKNLSQLTQRMADQTSIAAVFSGTVPQEELSVINAAERSGSLADGFMTLVNVITYNSELRSKLIGAVTFPIIMIILSLIVIGGYAVKVFPAFADVVPTDRWPGVTRMLFTFGTSLVAGLWLYILAFAIGLVLVIKFLMANVTGPFRNKVMDRVLPFSTYKQLTASIFLNNLSLMLRNGIPLHEGLGIISLNSNRWLKSHIAAMQHKMSAGVGYGQALNTGFFGAEELLNISLYASMPSFNEVLGSVSEKSRERIQIYISKLAGLLKSLSTLILGGCVVWVFIALFSLSNELSKSGSF